MTTTQVSKPPGSADIRKIAMASAIGCTIEWYDFFLYNTFAALVFNKLFFPSFDPLVGTMLAFATALVGFIARPIAGVLFGHFGDRVGRKKMLILTLLIMGIGTFLIGLLPTYESIGAWAAALLLVLRIAQGLGVGGEWGGAVLMAVEHAPDNRRGFYGAGRSWAYRRASRSRPAWSPILLAARRHVPAMGVADPVPAQHRARRCRH